MGSPGVPTLVGFETDCLPPLSLEYHQHPSIFFFFLLFVGCFRMIIWTPAVLSVLYACVS